MNEIWIDTGILQSKGIKMDYYQFYLSDLNMYTILWIYFFRKLFYFGLLCQLEEF